MSLLKRLGELYPLAVASFVKWLTARDAVYPMGKHIRVSLDELPIELSYGVFMLFLSESGIVCGRNVSTLGRSRSAFYGRTTGGTYRRIGRETVRESGSQDQFTTDVTAGFKFLNRRLERASAPRPEGEYKLIGIDVDSVMKRIKEKELAWNRK
jgi:hypothetical protein